MIMNENDLWQQIRLHETLQACQQYMELFPNGPHAQEVGYKIKILQNPNDPRLSRFLASYIQKGIVTLEGLIRAGIDTYKAKMLMRDLNISIADDVYTKTEHEIKNSIPVERLWHEACKKNTLEAYENYLCNSPGRHNAEAMRKLLLFDVDDKWLKKSAEYRMNYEVFVKSRYNRIGKFCPISTETTKIIYWWHSGSGSAIYERTMLLEDSLIWKCDKPRQGFSCEQSCKYNKEEFKELVQTLSVIPFFAVDSFNGIDGSAGYGYSFYSDTDKYFGFANDDVLLGDYNQVYSLIRQFIDAHPHPTFRE